MTGVKSLRLVCYGKHKAESRIEDGKEQYMFQSVNGWDTVML
jgi:hypothetical protein